MSRHSPVQILICVFAMRTYISHVKYIFQPLQLLKTTKILLFDEQTHRCLGCGHAIAAEFLGMKKDYSPCRFADGLFCRRCVVVFVQTASWVK